MKKTLTKPHSPVGGKLFFIMKLTFLINLVVLMQVSANVYSQDPFLTIQMKQATLEEVLTRIEGQSKFRFLYRSDNLKGLPKVDLDVDNSPVEKVLDQILLPNGLTYEISNETVVIRKRPAEKAQAVVTPAEIRVSGKVIDESNVGLPGVNILERGTTNGTITDIDGNYAITVQDNSVLVFSFVGYLTQEISVNSATVINVSLQPDVQALQEVVVIGYGTVNKSDLTGSVSSLRSGDLNPGANVSVDQMMQGRAAGVQISQSSSEPGGGLSVRVRGSSSINASNEPLYVIDGFPIDNSSNLSGNGLNATPEDAAAGGGFSLGNNISPRNPLNSLNPSDIESIEILKDASATAIYGSRGANGVILITTKKGKSDKMTVGYNTYMGTQSIANKMDVMSTQQYIQFLNDVSVDQGNGVVFTPADIAAIGAGTDWQNEIYRTAPISDHNISINGGMGGSKVYASLDYFNQQGIIKRTGIEKYIGRLNLDSKVSKKVNMGFNLNASLINDRNGVDGVNTNESAGPIYASLLYDPTEPVYQADGTLTDSQLLTVNNPVSLVEGVTSKSQTTRTLANFYTQVEIIEDLTAKINLGSDIQNSRRDVYVSRLTRRGGPQNGYADVTSLDRSSYLAEYTMTYKKEINSNNKFDVLGGITYQKFNFKVFNANIPGFPTDAISTNNLSLGDTNNDNLFSNREDNTLLSYLGRFNYTLFNKFLLTGSIRADGSSRFGANNKFGYFPSFAFGYKLSDESFVPDLFEELKLRASWGKTGNQEIANYASQLTFGTGPFAVLGGSVVGSVQPLRIANPDLKWETTTQINVGVDASIMAGKISATIDYFKKNTTDLLFNLPLPASSGFTSVLTNIGEVENSGFELLVNSTNITTPDFSW
ncbi:MAG: SusC/RagA family TonB-linked outer membrane protein, partial [Cyclobacteriaceae bacterium]